LQVTPECSGTATFNWANSGNGWYIDISTDSAFSTYSNKHINYLTTTIAPSGFSPVFAFQPDSTYYWRVWNGYVHVFGNSFKVPFAPATPVITQIGSNLYSSDSTGNQWYYQNAQISGATSPIYTPAATGNYYVIVTGSDGCVSDTSNVIYFDITGVRYLQDNKTINIFPNPAFSFINIEAPQRSEIEIYSMQGQLIKDFSSNGNKMNVDVSSFPGGVYVIEIKTEKGIVAEKLVKE
jgi:hypothetical protein